MMERYQVFVSSTYEDLKDERLTVLLALLASKYIPVGMELFHAASDEQFNYIKRIIDVSDYYVLIIGGRYGSLDDNGVSYTEKEYDYAVSKEIPILVFPHQNPEKLSFEHSEKDATKREQLELFREKVSKSRLIRSWNNKDELARLVVQSLNDELEIHPRPGWVRKDCIDKATNKDATIAIIREEIQKAFVPMTDEEVNAVLVKAGFPAVDTFGNTSKLTEPVIGDLSPLIAKLTAEGYLPPPSEKRGTGE